MELPLILVNFKCYAEGTGKGAVKLAKICSDVKEETGIGIAVAPQFADIYQVARKVSIPVFAQHIDPIDSGAFTGRVSAATVKEAGATGTIISHSERKLDVDEIVRCVEVAKKNGLTSVVCSDSLERSREIAGFHPDFLAYEPPELIGTGVSVSKTKPEIVSETVRIVKEIYPSIKVLCGAGITNGEDVRKAVELGTDGVILASGVVKSKTPREVLADFAKKLER
jgi:triosephosphate isomerase